MFVWKEHDSPFDFKYLKFLFYATEHMKEHMLNSIQDTTDTTDTNGMTEIRQAFLTGERAEFFARKRRYVDTVFADGESPLKHACDIELVESSFKWKYPLWYCRNVVARDCTWFEMGRAGVWYTDHIVVEDSTIEAPKNFRRCHDVVLRNVDFPNAEETLWSCSGVRLENVSAHGDYLAMNCTDVKADNLRLVGNYPFDGAHDVEISHSRLISKDCFWNCENVTVRDSFISGEYLAWNSRNVTFENCTIESLQGLCYVDNLVLRNCRLINTTLAFEYSTVDADVRGTIDSVLNPSAGMIRADAIGELTLDPERVDPSATTIVTAATARNASQQ